MRSDSEFLVDVVTRLEAAGLDYLLTGSMASNYWGIPRTTHDLDIVIGMLPHQTGDFLAQFAVGFFVQAASVNAAFRPPFQFNILDEQSAMKADFWLLRESEFEQSMFARRRRVGFFGTTMWIAAPEDIVLHKLYWNRLSPSDRQLQDVAGVFGVQGDRLDRAYIAEWAPRLGVDQEWNDVLSGKIRPKST